MSSKILPSRRVTGPTGYLGRFLKIPWGCCAVIVTRGGALGNEGRFRAGDDGVVVAAVLVVTLVGVEGVLRFGDGSVFRGDDTGDFVFFIGVSTLTGE